jgi:XTP/dITP diphosphohydrolase
VLATANPGKIKEMREILSALGIESITRYDLNIDIEIKETGSTFLDNATLKARAISNASGMSAIADDSGLVVDALGGEPGLYSSSYGGEELTNKERCLFLLKKMKNMEHRQAKFVCTIVCAFPDGSYLSASGECKGTILTEPRGVSGFGYDPVFKPDGLKKSMAELTAGEKNSISHRAAALKDFSSKLKTRISVTCV